MKMKMEKKLIIFLLKHKFIILGILKLENYNSLNEFEIYIYSFL